jgi:alkylated DNA repair dioxygenase AlkB
LPPLIVDLRAKAASVAGKPAETFEQVLVTEYAPGTALGWHRDRLQYGEIVGVSLLSPATFRLRRRNGDRWMRASRIIESRSVYIMADEVRFAWEHSIPAVAALRYSLTFRTLADNVSASTD